MTRSTRVFVAVACVATLAIGGAAAALCATVVRAGTVHVEVSEAGGSGSRLSLRLPGVLIPMAVSLVPTSAIRDASREVRPFLPAVRAAIDELQSCEDALFVEVRSRGEEVRIGKKDGALYVHVLSDGGTVDLSIPLHAVAPVLARLEAAARQVG